MQFPLTRFLYSYYQNPSSSYSYLLHEINGDWSGKKIAYASCGVTGELSPYILTVGILAGAIFSKISTTRFTCLTSIPALEWACFSACMIPSSSCIGSRIALMILKYLKVRSKIHSISDRELAGAVEQYSSTNPLSKKREQLILELTKRNLNRRDEQSQVLSDAMDKMPPVIKKNIFSYCEDRFQYRACQWIQKVTSFSRSNEILKNKLLQRCIYEPENIDSENIEEQIYLIAQLACQKEQISRLELLYQFHRDKGNYTELGVIIRACFKFMFALPRCPALTFIRDMLGRACSRLFLEIMQKLESRNDLSPDTLASIGGILTDEECFSDLFFQHYVLEKVNDKDSAVLDHVFQTLLLAEISRNDFRKFRNALIARLFPIGAVVYS